MFWDFGSSGLRGDVLRGDVLRGDVLRGDVLQGDVLQGAVLQGAVLQGAVLQGAVLPGDVLEGAVLQANNASCRLGVVATAGVGVCAMVNLFRLAYPLSEPIKRFLRCNRS